MPDWLVGVWQRLSIEENGEKDTTTKVIWIQTNSCFGDIRIPAERPVMGPGVTSLDTLSESLSEQTVTALSHQAGFAGITRLQGDTCEWHRALDYRPFNGQFDVGTLHWEGDILIETGVNGSYKEEWQRISKHPNLEPTAALTLLQGPARQAWFVMYDDAFIYGCDRRPSLPAAETLTTLLNESKTLPIAKQAQYLDCELSFGYRQSGNVPWEIQLSTLPWKEGTSLWQTEDLVFNQAQGHIIQTSGDDPFIWAVQEGDQRLFT